MKKLEGTLAGLLVTVMMGIALERTGRLCTSRCHKSRGKGFDG